MSIEELETYDDLERLLDMVWTAGVDPTSRHKVVPSAKAEILALIEAERIAEGIAQLEKLLRTPAVHIRIPQGDFVDGWDSYMLEVKRRLAELEGEK